MRDALEGYDRLLGTVARFPDDVLTEITWQADIIDQSRNPRDVLCHLHAWQLMTKAWVEVGNAGGFPATPGEGLTWRETPLINARIWERFRETTWPEAVTLLETSHADLVTLIEDQPESLFDKGVHPWTKTSSVGAYLTSATASHYTWGAKTLRAIDRARRGK